MKNCFIILLILLPSTLFSQVLLELHDDELHHKQSRFIAKAKLKSSKYTDELPFMLSMTLGTNEDSSSSEWTTDTITFAKHYAQNGLLQQEVQTLPNGDVYFEKRFEFDESGKLEKIEEINNQRLRFYDYQEMIYVYSTQLDSILKIRYKMEDTTCTKTVFTYDDGKLVGVVERSNNGDTIRHSTLSYYDREKYIEEQSFIVQWAEARTTYYYFLDEQERIIKVAHGLEGVKGELTTDRKIDYDFGSQIPQANDIFLKVEIYE